MATIIETINVACEVAPPEGPHTHQLAADWSFVRAGDTSVDAEQVLIQHVDTSNDYVKVVYRLGADYQYVAASVREGDNPGFRTWLVDEGNMGYRWSTSGSGSCEILVVWDAARPNELTFKVNNQSGLSESLSIGMAFTIRDMSTKSLFTSTDPQMVLQPKPT